jgi:hypothetical protein
MENERKKHNFTFSQFYGIHPKEEICVYKVTNHFSTEHISEQLKEEHKQSLLLFFSSSSSSSSSFVYICINSIHTYKIDLCHHDMVNEDRPIRICVHF